MQYIGREKAVKVVEFVAKRLNLCPSTVLCSDKNIWSFFCSVCCADKTNDFEKEEVYT